MVEVVDEANGNPARGCVLDRAADDRSRLRSEMEVVVREIERLPGLSKEGRDLPGDVDRLLPAVGQCPDVEKLPAQRTLTRRPTCRQRSAWNRSILVRWTG